MTNTLYISWNFLASRATDSKKYHLDHFWRSIYFDADDLQKVSYKDSNKVIERALNEYLDDSDTILTVKIDPQEEGNDLPMKAMHVLTRMNSEIMIEGEFPISINSYEATIGHILDLYKISQNVSVKFEISEESTVENREIQILAIIDLVENLFSNYGSRINGTFDIIGTTKFDFSDIISLSNFRESGRRVTKRLSQICHCWKIRFKPEFLKYIHYFKISTYPMVLELTLPLIKFSKEIRHSLAKVLLSPRERTNVIQTKLYLKRLPKELSESGTKALARLLYSALLKNSILVMDFLKVMKVEVWRNFVAKSPYQSYCFHSYDKYDVEYSGKSLYDYCVATQIFGPSGSNPVPIENKSCPYELTGL